MNILSYRGPARPGGVSEALTRIADYHGDNLNWWYTGDGTLLSQTGQSLRKGQVPVPTQIAEGHYRYCNNFLWPILHDMPERSTFCPRDAEYYRQFNRLFAINIMKSKHLTNSFFIQDYQLALLPAMLSNKEKHLISLFWHIPWPKMVERAQLPSLIEIASSLLSASKLGFHIQEYALNFMNFVRLHLRQFEVDFDSNRITLIKSKLEGDQPAFTKVEVLPLGLDIQFWKNISSLDKMHLFDRTIRRVCSSPYILSVDRADYTKGILQRISAIDHFFEDMPKYRGKLSFLQVCQQTRIGLPQFDKYWQQAQCAARELNFRWQIDDWQPLVWLSEPVESDHLASLYAHANAMLVNPVRDGLNLTAKEFIVCSQRVGSVLMLSPGAGVSQEIGDLACLIEPHSPALAARQIAASLAMPIKEKIRRIDALKLRVESNPLDLWWKTFTDWSVQEGGLSLLPASPLPQLNS